MVETESRTVVARSRGREWGSEVQRGPVQSGRWQFPQMDGGMAAGVCVCLMHMRCTLKNC